MSGTEVTSLPDRSAAVADSLSKKSSEETLRPAGKDSGKTWSPDDPISNKPSYPYKKYAENPPAQTPTNKPSAFRPESNPRWQAYLKGRMQIFDGPDDTNLNFVETGDLIPEKLPYPWEISLVKGTCHGQLRDRIYYILCFRNAHSHTMHSKFPPGYVWVTEKGFTKLEDAKQWKETAGRKYSSECEMGQPYPKLEVPGWPSGILTSYANFDAHREIVEWEKMFAEDKDDVKDLAKKYYSAEINLEPPEHKGVIVGHHQFDIPTPSRVQWVPHDSANRLPMGWEAYLCLTTGTVIYYDRLGKKAQQTHPDKGFRTEGLPRQWQLRWRKDDDWWKPFYRDHKTKKDTAELLPGFAFEEGKGFRAE